MSENRKCVNCRHRIIGENCSSKCEIDGHYISYGECFMGWCKHWARQKDGNESKFVVIDDLHTLDLTEETIKCLEELRQMIYDKCGISKEYFTSHHIGTYLARDMQLPAIIKKNEKVWQENLEMLQDGFLGDVNSPKTLLRYWKLQAEAHYPSAEENVRYFEDMVRKSKKLVPRGQHKNGTTILLEWEKIKENENAENKG